MKYFYLILGLVILLASSSTFGKFPPDELTNLKVLPKDISFPELMTNMKGFTQALGVRCEHCHVGEPGMPLSEFDFAADEKPTKLAARVMLKMLTDINETQLSKVPESVQTGLEVSCVTCHRGQQRPILIADAMTKSLEKGGVEEMLAHYDQLREQYYGSHILRFHRMDPHILH